MNIFVTGGCGFIGSNFIRYWLQNYPRDSLLNFDALTYAGNPENLRDVESDYEGRYEFVHADICDVAKVDESVQRFHPDVIINFAAESHNSNAIQNPKIFFKTNLLGAQTLLDATRKYNVPRFHHISTCEVYGDLALNSNERFTENSPYNPQTPYNASKAAADFAVRAYIGTFHLPATISNC